MEPFCIVMHLVFFGRWVFVLSAPIIGLYASVTRRICTSCRSQDVQMRGTESAPLGRGGKGER